MENSIIKIDKPDDMYQVFKDGQEIEIEGIKLRYKEGERCGHCALDDFDSSYCLSSLCARGVGGAFVYVK